MNGRKNALSITGKIPPIVIFNTVLLITLPVIQVNAPAKRVTKLPKMTSISPHPVKRFESKQPTNTETIVSGNISGNKQSPSLMRSCTAPLANDIVKRDKRAYRAATIPHLVNFFV